MTPTSRRSNRPAGIVLAGGYSRRFGPADKSLARLDGTPLVRHVIDRLGTVTEIVVVSCRADQRPGFERTLDGTSTEIRYAIDPVADQGPVVGVLTALDCIERPFVAVVACDMPFVDPDFLEFLFETAADRDGAVPTDDEGIAQPAQAVYRAKALEAAGRAAVAEGQPRLQRLLDRLDVALMDRSDLEYEPDPEGFINVNTPAELQALERRVARRSR